MKMKPILVLWMSFFLLVISGCSGSNETKLDYNGYTYEDLLANSQNLVSTLSNMTEEEKNSYLSSNSQLTVDLVTNWNLMEIEFGEFQESKEFQVEVSGETLTCIQIISLKERDIKLFLIFDYDTMTMTGTTLEPVYSVGEIMEKAGVNTLMGITVVFAVLILISLVISCFNLFPYLEKKRDEKKAQLGETRELDTDKQKRNTNDVNSIPKAAQIPQVEEEELIVVIAAAIAASEGRSTEDFIVRSIRRR